MRSLGDSRRSRNEPAGDRYRYNHGAVYFGNSTTAGSSATFTTQTIVANPASLDSVLFLPTTLSGNASIQIEAGDFNGDGVPDLATANYGANTVSVLYGNGSGGLGLPVSNLQRREVTRMPSQSAILTATDYSD